MLKNNYSKAILTYFLEHNLGKSSEIADFLKQSGLKISTVTVKRHLSSLVKEGVLRISGAGPSTTYELSASGQLFAEIDAKAYCQEEPDRRPGRSSYNFDLFRSFPKTLIDSGDMKRLKIATDQYRIRSTGLSLAALNRETERFIVEMSWKSSKIEGNTYSILETERLIREGVEAAGHPSDEAVMILNHKKAFRYVLDNRPRFQEISTAMIETVHGIMVDGLGVTKGIRSGLVGITGSKYRPLDNHYQIQEALVDLTKAVSRLKTGYEKAILTIMGISYIQPFEDGNKRTARMMANAVLLAHHLSPLSYRSVEVEDYRQAVLVFYELNAIGPFQKLFVEQYEFAAGNYAAF